MQNKEIVIPATIFKSSRKLIIRNIQTIHLLFLYNIVLLKVIIQMHVSDNNHRHFHGLVNRHLLVAEMQSEQR